jgi:uncharacterized protein (DUF1499 family)
VVWFCREEHLKEQKSGISDERRKGLNMNTKTEGIPASEVGAYVSPEVQARLQPCPDSPNCVSTLARDAEHGIAPLVYVSTMAEAKQRLLKIIEEMPRTKIVEEEGNYLHTTFTSLIFRFVDDVEFVFDDAAKLIHFRSASRLGKGDLGVNRRRMEKIRAAFGQA